MWSLIIIMVAKFFRQWKIKLPQSLITISSSNLTLNLSKKKYLSNYIEFNQRNSLAKLCMYILTYVLYGQESEIWHKIEKNLLNLNK